MAGVQHDSLAALEGRVEVLEAFNPNQPVNRLPVEMRNPPTHEVVAAAQLK
jgi:hypothetical protein